MGISGLLPLLKDISVPGHISAFKGKRLAVDAYVWLHKGAFGCAEDLVKGKKTTRFVDYAMHRVRMLRHFGVEPFIVFDGGPLPAKKGTEDHRAKSRAESLARAQSMEAQGRMKEARDAYTKCLDITPELAFQLIKALRAEAVEYVVAPYEADAQLTYLETMGFVDGIITEDSDLLVYGCKQVVFKLDGNGQCVSIHRDKLATIRDFPMHGWTDVQFRRMAMLSGCDYLESVPGIGMKTAHRLLRKHKTVEKVLQVVRLEGVMTIPPTYAADFARAELPFMHQRVFCPSLRKLVSLNDLPDDSLTEEQEKWIGTDISSTVAQGIASGDIHPETLLPIIDQWPDFIPASRSKPRPLTTTTKGNIKAGPMDAFLCRKTRPAAMPKPVGVFGSGPSRLSDQPSTMKRAFEPTQTSGLELKESKFFAPSSTRAGKRKVTVEVEEVIELVWESSGKLESQVEDESAAGPSQTPTPPSPPFEDDFDFRSPSSFGSSLLDENSPVKSLPNPGNMVFTSPGAPLLSSPAASSQQSLDPFSPSPIKKRARSASPMSPTRSSFGEAAPVLIGASSQPISLTQSLATSQLVSLTPSGPRQGRRTGANQERVLIPGSSPYTSAVEGTRVTAVPQTVFSGGQTTSSDSIEEDQVVTPSVDVLGKRRSNSDPEGEEADKRREEKAKAISAGWRAKYSMQANIGFPTPRSTARPKGVRSASDPKRRWPATRAAETSTRVLSERSLNRPFVLDVEPVVRITPTPERSATKESEKRTPLQALEPCVKGCAGLQKFKFTGRVSHENQPKAMGL